MDYKTCIKCNELKPCEEFPKYKTKTGFGIRNVCKTCYGTQEKQRRTHKFLSSEDVEILRTIISNHKKFLTEVSCSKSERIPKTINIEKDIYNYIANHCKNKSLSVSDVINTLLKEGIKYLE